MTGRARTTGGDGAGIPGPWRRLRASRAASWTPAHLADLTGRTVVVTGSSRGIGAAAAVHLARHGAHVIILCPSASQGRASAEAVRRRVTAARVESVTCDLARPDQVREAAGEITRLVGGRLDVLINNAGVAALPYTRSPAGFEMHFAVNHLGHFALTGHLLPALLSAPRPRVVNVTSVLHWLGRCRTDRPHLPRRYHRWPAYFDSKLANLLFTHGLTVWAQARGVPLRAVAAHPGLVDTTLGSRALYADGRRLEARLLRWGQSRWHSPSQAAWSLVRAAGDPHVAGGEFFGPGGRWEWSGAPVRVRAARRARDDRAAERLWQLSQRLTGHPFPASPGWPGRGGEPS
ncbi:SDR family NAD(P)-dependent oxidoreductase [Streptomyces sp. BK79]|uniref:SDR family NAD(P)-dependent oxidoreductase n=1 Tax=Streptomyces sp. BK79 TaxID=3350097 RepID=UPI00376F513D